MSETGLGALQQVETPRLSIGYLDDGPRDGPMAILLHGWPDDAYTLAPVATALNDAGWRTVRPFLRGFGPTHFRDGVAPSGDLAALAQDVLDLADALAVARFAIVGHDWGARAAYIAACVAPERIIHCVAMSVGWGTNDPGQTLSLRQVQNYWYHWYMANDRGERLVREERAAFTRYLWDTWSVARPVDEATFARLLTSFENPAWADVVLHSYRVRWGWAAPDPHSVPLAARVTENPIIALPTTVIHGGADPANDPSTSAGKEHLFSAAYTRHIIEGVGHFPQWEAPDETAKIVVGALDRGR